MPSLQITAQQSSAMSEDVVRRHEQLLSRRADRQMEQLGEAPADAPAAAVRLKALHATLRDDLPAKAGAAAPHVAVDLDHCARQLYAALQAGATFREPAAAALMSAAAALGLRWLGDERLYATGITADDMPPDEIPDDDEHGQMLGETPLEALPEPREAAELRAWAEAGWASRFRVASRRSRSLRAPTRYALEHAISNEFAAHSLRAVADAVFSADEADRLRRFLHEERALLAAAGLDNRSLGDRRIESLCLAADLAYGLGRFVRLAQAAAAAPADLATPRAGQLHNHLREALNALAEQS